jgi:6-phosphogluconolactonase
MRHAFTPRPHDERRQLAIFPTQQEALAFATQHWLSVAREAIGKRGRFLVALSGGSTPKSLYEKLALHPQAIDWGKAHLFFSDERSVPPDHPDSNYAMARQTLAPLPLVADQIHRCKGEKAPHEAAQLYDALLRRYLPLDLVMLGIGEADGHTASLFPASPALHETTHLAAAAQAPNGSWRITLTFPPIHSALQTVLYAFGPAKAPIVAQALSPLPSPLPASRVGTPERPALWILDQAAASQLGE